MAISRFKTSTLAQGLPKYTELWDQTTSGFSPTSISGLYTWLDATQASTITSSSGAVSQWNDASGNGHHFAQATSTNQPTTGTRTINGKNVLDFDGTNDVLKSTEAASTWGLFHNATNATSFIVFSADSNQATGLIGTSNDTNQAGIWYYLTATPKFGAATLMGTSNSFVSLDYSPDNEYTANTPMVHTVAWDADNGTASSRVSMYKNSGAENSVYSQSQGSYTSSAPANTAFIGGFPGATGTGSDWFNGTIAEVIIYTGILSSTDRNKVSDYLKSKWGIA